MTKDDWQKQRMETFRVAFSAALVTNARLDRSVTEMAKLSVKIFDDVFPFEEPNK